MNLERQQLLKLFGPQGPYLRNEVRDFVEEKHVDLAGAQATSKNRSTGVYGEIWRGLLEVFEEFGRLPGSSLIRPGKAPYRVPIVNNVVIFPWRFDGGGAKNATNARFVSSPSRLELTGVQLGSRQVELDLGLGQHHDSLTLEDRKFLEALQIIHEDEVLAECPLVVVAISSTPRSLQRIEWGTVDVLEDGTLRWNRDFYEILFENESADLISIDIEEKFDDGDLPARLPQSRKQDSEKKNG